MTPLITSDIISRLNKKTLLVKRARLALCLGCLAVCILLCINLRTGNAFKRYIAVCAVSLACGWFVIVTYSRVKAMDSIARHFVNLSGRPGTEYIGILEYSPLPETTPDGLRVRRLRVRNAQDTHALLADEYLIDQLPPAGKHVRLEARSGYVWAAGEENDA